MHSLVAETTLRKVSYINGEHIMLHVERAAQAQGREYDNKWIKRDYVI